MLLPDYPCPAASPQRYLLLLIFALALLSAAPAAAAEIDALRISERIVQRHLPFGTILDPILGPAGQITGYTRCGDSALWTGAYLAAESFRWRVTKDPLALENARRALRGIRLLTAVTGGEVLARCAVPLDSPFTPGILNEESVHGYFSGAVDGKAYFWVANTSRDQYIGVFFGLAAAYEHLDDPGVKAEARELITTLLNPLLANAWTIRQPDGSLSSTMLNRADQQLALLAIGRLVNPDRFRRPYEMQRLLQGWNMAAPVAVDALDPHNSYFKFHLDALNLYALLRLETASGWRRQYENAYGIFRRTVERHENALFNLIDRALRGPDAARDAETRLLLDRWLLRPTLNPYVDLRQSFPACYQPDRACDVIPVERRVPTDFLWQRSPFLLYGGGAGNVEGAGIDYILPFWMARYLGVL